MPERICNNCSNSEWEGDGYETACLYCHYIGDTVEPFWTLTCFEPKDDEEIE